MALRKPYEAGEDQQVPEKYSKTSRNWQVEPEEKRGGAVVETLHALLDDQSDYLAECEVNLRMYRNLQASGTIPMRIVKEMPDGRTTSLVNRQVGLNIARPMCNTVASKIFKGRPRTWFNTDGAGREARHTAKMLQGYNDGLNHEQNKPRKARRVGLDSLVMGTGFLKTAPNLGTNKYTVQHSRIFTPQCLVDRIDGAEGLPRSMYEIGFANKYKLAKMYPKHEDQILKMQSNWYQNYNIWWRNFDSDKHATLMYCIGYTLPSFPGAGDGVMCVGLNDLTLETHEYKEMDHVYTPIRWLESPDGYYGMGLCEELRGVQGEINRLMRRIQAAMILLSSPYVFMDKDSGVSAEHIAGIPGTTIKHNPRKKPTIEAPSVVHPEVFSHLDRLYQRGFEIAGVSQMSATAKVQANIESGRGVLVQEELQSDRFAAFDMQWMEMHVDSDKKALRCASSINHKVKILDPTTRALTEIDWDSMKIPKDGWEIKGSATSLIKIEPEGKLESFERLDQQGLVLSRATKLAYYEDDPDMAAYVARETAPRRYFESLFEGFVYDGKPYDAPNGVMDLNSGPDSGIPIAQEVYGQAKAEGVADEELQKIEIWVETARQMIQDAQRKVAPPPMPQLPGMPGAPPGMPSGPALMPPAGGLPGMPPPPVPELLPQVA